MCHILIFFRPDVKDAPARQVDGEVRVFHGVLPGPLLGRVRRNIPIIFAVEKFGIGTSARRGHAMPLF